MNTVLAIFLYWSLHCLLSFRFLAWPSPWHSSSRFTGLAKNMMLKASETLSHQPFCLIIKMNKRSDCKEYQAKPCWLNPSHCLIYFVVTWTDIITTCCLIHIFVCFTFAIYLPKRGKKASEPMDFLNKIIDLFQDYSLDLRTHFALPIHAKCAEVI